MGFQDCIDDGRVFTIPPDPLRAKSLLVSSEEAIESAKSMEFSERRLKSIMRELYEGLRQYCEAIGYLKGYKFSDHESISHFIRDILKDEKTAIGFDRYRKLRNGINYYGNDVKEETVKDALSEVPKIIRQLKRFV